MKALAEEEGLQLTDLYAVAENCPDLFCTDATHFNEAGQAALAEAVAAALMDQFPKSVSQS